MDYVNYSIQKGAITDQDAEMEVDEIAFDYGDLTKLVDAAVISQAHHCEPMEILMEEVIVGIDNIKTDNTKNIKSMDPTKSIVLFVFYKKGLQYQRQLSCVVTFIARLISSWISLIMEMALYFLKRHP